MKRVSLLILLVILLFPAVLRAQANDPVPCEKITWLKSVVLFCENRANENGSLCGEVEKFMLERIEKYAKLPISERWSLTSRISEEKLRGVLNTDECTTVRRATGATHLLKYKFSFPASKVENDPGSLETRFTLINLLTGETENAVVTNSNSFFSDDAYFARLGKCRWRLGSGSGEDSSKSASPVPPSLHQPTVTVAAIPFRPRCVHVPADEALRCPAVGRFLLLSMQAFRKFSLVQTATASTSRRDHSHVDASLFIGRICRRVGLDHGVEEFFPQFLGQAVRIGEPCRPQPARKAFRALMGHILRDQLDAFPAESLCGEHRFHTLPSP